MGIYLIQKSSHRFRKVMQQEMLQAGSAKQNYLALLRCQAHRNRLCGKTIAISKALQDQLQMVHLQVHFWQQALIRVGISPHSNASLKTLAVPKVESVGLSSFRAINLSYSELSLILGDGNWNLVSSRSSKLSAPVTASK
mmetsp:Transcript_22593/g.47436  ORF Transcript_22593/g.47436 Transcript_22593/m.47436 type:complete len:140 (+) Transcript_22593:1378-1797(+)